MCFFVVEEETTKANTITQTCVNEAKILLEAFDE